MRPLAAAATAGHAGLLAGAFLFQLMGYAPCAMCLWQRWPHAAAILFGVAVLSGSAPRAMAVFAAMAACVTAAIGAFHAGVEQGWWEGPSSCTGGGSGLGGLTGADLLDTGAANSVVMCDAIVWQLGLTMAGWNAVLSAALAIVWIAAFRQARRTGAVSAS